MYTGFKSKVNLNNKVNVESDFFEADGQKNSLIQIKNEFKIIYKFSKEFNANATMQTFIPDSKKHGYQFLGFEAAYNFAKMKCAIFLTGQNLLNHKTFSSVSVSDYAVSSFSYKLQERNISLGLRFKIF